MASVWKGTVSFGLVSIPVKASVASRPETILFNMLHAECHSRIKQKTVCPVCDKEISRSDTLKGYEVSKDKYVIITEDELEAVKPESTHVMEITEMVPASEVDPLLFDASYYLEPELAGRKGYRLLHDALVAEERYAVAKVTMSGREHIAIVRPFGKLLVFHTMYFQDEVRPQPVSDLGAELTEAELGLARQLVAVNAAPFEHQKYCDMYRAQVGGMIAAKANGETIPVTAPKPKANEPVDIMQALLASLERKGAAPAAAAAPAAPAAAAAPAAPAAVAAVPAPAKKGGKKAKAA